MKIMIDCFKLIKGEGKSTGIYNVARRIARSFVKTDNEIILLVNKYSAEDFDFGGKQIVVENFFPKNKLDCIRWELIGVAAYAKKYNPDLVIFPRGFCPLVPSEKYVPVIHDLIPFWYEKNYPGVLNRVENFYIRWRLRASAKAASRVVTVSEYSKKEIADTFSIDKNKIRVLYNRVDEPEKVSFEYDNTVSRPYILALASKLPHKNTEGMIRAYKEYCRLTEKPLDLMLIGNVGESACIAACIADCIAENGNIIVKSFISDDAEFYDIIGKARLFMFLSLIEGFGLPPIEAMLRGVPVLCANTSCLPEVVKGAIMMAPDDDAASGRAIKDILENEDLRRNMIDEGLLNAKKYVGDYSQDELCVFYTS